MKSTDVAPERRVLRGVPALSFDPQPDGRVELTPFASALRSCLTYLGDPWPYEYLMATCGAAFRLTWAGWELDNVALHYIDEDPGAPFRWALGAVGRDHEIIHDPGRFREVIVASIKDRGTPVLAFGVVGPPEPCVITGYDDAGDVLIGRSFFQGMPDLPVEYETSGYFRKRHWLPDTESVIVLSEPHTPPPLEEAGLEALRRALRIVRTAAVVPRRHNGLAAYVAWADALAADDDFPAGEHDVLLQRQAVHNDAATVVAEGRWYGSLFLALLAKQLPFLAPDLLNAAACYAGEHAVMWDLWRLIGGPGRGEGRAIALSDRSVRECSAILIRHARDLDQRAAYHIERALASSA